MFEVESKAFILNYNLEKIKQFASANFDFLKEEIKKDIYYSDQKKTVRIRTTQKEKIITFKTKSLDYNVEVNKEIEFKVDNLKNFLIFLEEIEFKIFYTKIKKSLIYKINNINIEINEIEGLGSFLEVEKIVAEKTEVNKAKKEVLEIIKLFGLQNNIETKSYFELLKSLER